MAAIPMMVYALLVLAACVAAGGEKLRQALMRQRWITPALAVTAIFLAIWLGVEAFRVETRGMMRPLVCGFGGLILAGVAGVVTGIQRRLDGLARVAMGLLPGLAKARTGSITRVLVILLAANPIGPVAAFTSGLLGDPRLLLWKGVVDAMTIVGVGRLPLAGLSLGAALSMAIHGGCFAGGLALSRWMGSSGGMAPWLMGVALFWLPMPMLLLRIRALPLGTLALVPCLALALSLMWR